MPAVRLVPEPASGEEEAQGGVWSSSQASELVFKILFGGLVSSAAGLAFVPVCWSLLLPWDSLWDRAPLRLGLPSPQPWSLCWEAGAGTALVTEQDLGGPRPSVC